MTFSLDNFLWSLFYRPEKDDAQHEPEPPEREPRDPGTRSGLVVGELEGAIPADPDDQGDVVPGLRGRVPRDRLIDPRPAGRAPVQVLRGICRNIIFEVVEVEIVVAARRDGELDVVGLGIQEVNIISFNQVIRA